jgi:cyanophycinase-like exopeptidase
VDGVTQSAPDISGRSFNFLLPPAGAGPLFLAGDLATATKGEVKGQFVTAAGATGKPTVVLAGGTVTATGAEGDARYWRNRLTSLGLARPQIATLTANTDLDALATQLANAGAIFFTADNQEILAGQLSWLHDAGLDSQLADWWHSGGVLLVNFAAAGAAGPWMSAEATPTGSFVEYQSSDSFLSDYIHIAPGLNLVPGALFETRVMYDYLYGRLVSHIVAHPENVAIGLERGMALVLTPESATIVGDNPAFVVDGRYAQTLGVGTNDAFVATWLLVDTFAPGNSLTD